VCTGAFVLGHAGLLAGKRATTHHDFHDRFAAQFPDVKLERGVRFVEGAPNLATAGGLTSGIDLALRVVERYFGRDVAERTANYMEYQSRGWIAPAA
jgi:transcriptional regulator GlxA family with amidase domain